MTFNNFKKSTLFFFHFIITIVIAVPGFALDGNFWAKANSEREAVRKVWKFFCSRYCEGHRGRIVSMGGGRMTVKINGNIRKIHYKITGKRAGKVYIYMKSLPHR